MSTTRSKRTSSPPDPNGLQIHAAPGQKVPIIVSGVKSPIATVATALEDVVVTISVTVPAATFESLELVAKQGPQGSWRAHVLPPRAGAETLGSAAVAAAPELSTETPSAPAPPRVTDFDVTLTKDGRIKLVVVGSGFNRAHLPDLRLVAATGDEVEFTDRHVTRTGLEAKTTDQDDQLFDGVWTPRMTQGTGDPVDFEFEFDAVELRMSEGSV